MNCDINVSIELCSEGFRQIASAIRFWNKVVILISYLLTAKRFSDYELLRGAALAPGAEDQGGGEVPDPGAILDQETKVVAAVVKASDEAPARTAPGRGAAPDLRIRTHHTALNPMR